MKLIDFASSFIGVTEKGGANKGTEVEMFQKAVDGKAQGEPWCMSFVQYCVKHCIPNSSLFNSEHCLTVWNKAKPEAKHKQPFVGAVIIWRHGSGSSGHTGFVVDVDGDYMTTIEGNTGTSDKTVERNGDGVYKKKRHVKGTGSMNVVGFLDPNL